VAGRAVPGAMRARPSPKPSGARTAPACSIGPRPAPAAAVPTAPDVLESKASDAVTIEAYAELSIHRWMLRDEIRNDAYRRAIAQVVKPGQRVLDMGGGTGFLSILAAQAGASRVYLVERTSIAGVARRMVERNGVAERVDVLEGNLEDVDLPEKVDVIISEWMGGIGVDENMLAPLVIARNRWLKPGGVMIPASVTALLVPAWIESFDENLRHWRTKPHGVDMSVIAELTANEPLMCQTELTADDFLAAPQVRRPIDRSKRRSPSRWNVRASSPISWPGSMRCCATGRRSPTRWTRRARIGEATSFRWIAPSRLARASSSGWSFAATLRRQAPANSAGRRRSASARSSTTTRGGDSVGAPGLTPRRQMTTVAAWCK
jgi:predicted RNA methylase